MQKPKVTILIPCYNMEAVVGRAIRSALSQTYSPLEVWVMDDASADRTAEVIEEFRADARFRYHKHKQNLGRVRNYRAGLFEFATGDYVLNLDGDDYLVQNDYLEQAIELISLHNLVAVFGRQAVLFENENRFVVDKIVNNLPEIVSGNDLFLNFAKGYSISHLSTVYQRKRAIEVDYYANDLLSADVESFLKLIIGARVGFLNLVAGVWVQHGSNATNVVNFEGLLDNHRYLENVHHFALSTSKIVPEQLNLWRHRVLHRFFAKYAMRAIVGREVTFGYVLAYVKQVDFAVYEQLRTDWRLIAFRVLGRFKWVSWFVYRYIIGIESLHTHMAQKKQQSPRASL